MSGLDNAAAAFAEDMGGSPSSAREDGGSAPVMTESDVFPYLGGHDDDAGVAGGDNEPTPKPRRSRAERDEDEEARLAAEGDDEDDEEIFDPDGDDEEADPEDGDDEDDDDEEATDLYEVTVDGEPVQVDLKEALNGYVRSETFYRRLNKLGEFETAVNARSAEVDQQLATYVEKTRELDALLDSLVPAEPDWDDLYAKDSVKARKLQKDYEDLKAKRGEVAKAREQAIAEARAKGETNFKKWKTDQNNMLARAFPTWSDPEKGAEVMKRDVTAMARTAKAAGFSDEEIENTHDARMIIVLNKAAAYDRMMSRKTPKPVPKGKPPVTQGAGRTRTAPKGKTRNNMSKLSRTGRLEDAAAVFQDIISR